MIIARLSDDIPLEGILDELERLASPHGLEVSEALNWILTIPGLDEFFGQVAEHKRIVKDRLQ